MIPVAAYRGVIFVGIAASASFLVSAIQISWSAPLSATLALGMVNV
jgi:hypothetical protein